MTSWRTGLVITLAAVAGLWLAFCLAGFVWQRSFYYAPGPDLGPPAIQGVDIQVVRLKTARGETTVNWYLPPKPGMPTLLFFAGNGDSLQLQEGRWKRISDAGVGFLAVAYDGYSGSTGKPTEVGIHADADAAYAWLTERTPPKDIVIHGYSLGTGPATKLARGKAVRGLVLEAPYTAFVDLVAERAWWAPVRTVMRDRYLSRDWISGVGAPVLIVHGSLDSVIPISHAEKMFALAHGPKTFVRMVGSDHNTLVRDGLYDQVWRFLGVPVSGTAAPGFAAKTETSFAP